MSGGPIVATDQQGSGQLYQYIYTSNLGNDGTSQNSLSPTDFFQVTPAGSNATSRVSGLVPTSNDQPGLNEGEWAEYDSNNFAVNPFDSTAIVTGSLTGDVFLTFGNNTGGTGKVWKQIATGSNLDSSETTAFAFGAPTTANGQTDNYIFAGTEDGHIYVTYTGGGYNGSSNWRNISNGLPGAGQPILQIVTDTKPGSTDAYAITADGVYYCQDTSASNATPTWVKLNDLTGTTTKIADATTKIADATTKLASAITSSATTITVTSAAGFPAAPFVVTIGSENIYVLSTSGTNNTTLVSVVRGFDGTTPAAALSGATITQAVDALTTTMTVASDSWLPARSIRHHGWKRAAPGHGDFRHE